MLTEISITLLIYVSNQSNSMEHRYILTDLILD